MEAHRDKATVEKRVVGGKTFFRLACEDAARLTSMLAFDSDDVLKPRNKQPSSRNVLDQLNYFGKAFYLVAVGGFVPYYFKVLPFPVFKLWSVLNGLFRKFVLSVLMRLRGYGTICAWDGVNLGVVTELAEAKSEADAKPYEHGDLAVTGRLATLDSVDPELSVICEGLASKGALIAPHSQANPNPLSAVKQIMFGRKFPGNFFDHLIGVWKVLVAWKQPRYICRGGMFHSVYGTNQYRAGLWGYHQRNQVRDLVGPRAEQLAFLICTAERSEIGHALCEVMYNNGKKFGGIRPLTARATFQKFYRDPNNRVTARLTEEGFPVMNHITGKTHRFSPRVFASFVVVMLADFLEQGVSALGYYSDDDITFFQFLRMRFWADVVNFVSPYLDVVPPVFEKYLLKQRFEEPSRAEIINFKRIWDTFVMPTCNEGNNNVSPLRAEDKEALVNMVENYPWIPEPKLALGVALKPGEAAGAHTRASLADGALDLLREWGMLHYKQAGHVRDALRVMESVKRN